MHRAVFLGAILLGALGSMLVSGCTYCDCALPLVEDREWVNLDPFMIDDATPARGFVLDVLVGGGWFATSGIYLDPVLDLGVSRRVDDEVGAAEIAVVVTDEQGATVREGLLSASGDASIVLGLASVLLQGCEEGARCHRVLGVDVLRNPDLGEALVTLEVDAAVSGPEEEDPYIAVTLEAE